MTDVQNKAERTQASDSPSSEPGVTTPSANGRRRIVQAIAKLRARSNGRIALGAVSFFLVTAIAIFAPLIAPQDPQAVDLANRLMAPSAENLLGTDANGRDVLSRVIYGSRISILVGISVVVATTILGGAIGLVSGYYRRLDGLIMRSMDAFMAFPSTLLAIAIMAALGASARNVVLALTVAYTPRTARVVRGKVLSIREESYVESARSIGFNDFRIMWRYVLPNALAPLVVQATFILALAIIAEAGLSFVGAGTPPPAPSWGNMLADGRQFMRQATWITIFPGLMIMISVLSLNVLGDGLRDMLDPRMKNDSSM